MTLSPYLGEDAIQPFVDYPDRLIYVLARTSNPDAGRLQDVTVRTDRVERPLHEAVAGWVAVAGRKAGWAWWSAPPRPASSRGCGGAAGARLPGARGGRAGRRPGGRGARLPRDSGARPGEHQPGDRGGVERRATGGGAAGEAAQALAGGDGRGRCYTACLVQPRSSASTRNRRDMGPIGWPELIILLVVVLIVFGPGKLPDIGNAIGQGSAASSVRRPTTSRSRSAGIRRSRARLRHPRRRRPPATAPTATDPRSTATVNVDPARRTVRPTSAPALLRHARLRSGDRS